MKRSVLLQMKPYDSSLHTNNPVSQAENSLNKLHQSVSQALSHPTEQTLEQMDNRLEHTEQSVEQAVEFAEEEQGGDFLKEALVEEKQRLRSLEDPS
jgi:hypothetical protein